MALGSPRVGAVRRMQAAGIDTFGRPVRLLELAAPASPAPDEVVISVHAAGVGNWDEFVRVGNWDVGRQPPLALGVEAAGAVALVGNDVTSLAAGDQVLPTPCRCGTRARGRSGCSRRRRWSRASRPWSPGR
jgi:NADPH:quinone reductase-like Zn-dependent oxidoreductase